ncbi:TPA: hypothetical protein ACNICG_003430 [Acinetobacter baumannii]
MSSNQIDLNKERELFEATQDFTCLSERIEYIAALNAYMPKHQFANQLIVMQAAERLSFGWSMWLTRAKVQEIHRNPFDTESNVERSSLSRREAFEVAFKKTEIYKRESNIRENCILEFSESMNGYFNIVTNEAWTLWLSVPEGYALLPIKPTKEIHQILGYQCYKLIRFAKIYRELGFDIKKKAEDEQAFFLFKFLHLALEHGENYFNVFSAQTKTLYEAKLAEKQTNEQ